LIGARARELKPVKLDKILTWIVVGWLTLFFLSRMLVTIALVLVGASPWVALRSEAFTLLAGFNPLNGSYFLVRVTLLSPAIIAFIWRQMRRRRIVNESATVR
jgi:hypothetical protein